MEYMGDKTYWDSKFEIRGELSRYLKGQKLCVMDLIHTGSSK